MSKLKDIKEKQQLTFRVMGDMTGLHLQHIARLVYGKAKPSRIVAKKLIEVWPELTYDELMKEE